MKRYLTLASLLLSALLVGGCSSEQSWQTQDIAGMMPDLEFTLTSETGETVSAERFTDKVNLLFFGYTHCPDICPITLGRLRGVINQLPDEVADQLRVLFVSVDPQRDGPPELRAYTDQFGERFVGLTGSRERLDALTKRYRTTYGFGEPDAQGNYEVSHGSAVYAFNQQGEIRLLFRSGDKIEAIASDLEQLVHS